MARIGLLIPSSNTSVEPEFYRALPREVTLHVARLFLTHITPESLAAMSDDIERQAKLLATADVDVIMLGAVAPGVLKPGYDRELSGRIRAATGKQASTAATALLGALRHLGVARIAIGAPYDDRVNALARSFLQAAGIEVVATRELGLKDNLQVGRLGAEAAYELGRKVDCPAAGAIVFAGTNMRSMDALEPLERDLGKPVISTTAVSLWEALRIIGCTEGITGYGRLLRSFAGPAAAR